MAITISGINNNDRIVATDGTIDALSGFNVVGVMTAASFSGDLVGNVTGNVTGNINNTTLLLQTSGTERIRITGNNEIGIAGANYGSAGQVLTSGGSGSAVSWTTLTSGVTSDSEENTIGGTGAGDNLDSDTYRNTLFGYQAGEQINSGDDNTLVGWKAADKLTSGYKNCAFGSEALEYLTSGYDNVAMGWEAGRSCNGNGNTMIGNMAGRTMSGSDNIAIGDHAYSNGGGTRSIGLGGESVWLGGTDVIGIGQYTMARGGSQIGGIGIGRYAGRNNAGDHNVYLGYEAGYGTGSSPYAIGNYNISLGYRSLYSITSASSNVAIGASAGDVLTTGGNNIILGDGADASSATISNEVTIGNSSINHVRIPGIGVSFSEGGAVISGVVTATSFVGDGSGLSGITQTTINSNTNNYLITGTGTANTLQGEANLTFDGAELDLNNSGGSARLYLVSGNSADSSIYFGRQNDGATGGIRYEHTDNSLQFMGYNNSERLRITSDGQIGVNNTSPDAWYSTYRSIQIYDGAVLYGSADDSFVGLGANHFLNTSGDFKYANTDFASRFYQVNGGFHFESAASGTAGNTFSFTERLRIDTSGNLFLRSASANYLVMGSSGDATSGGVTNNMNWIRGNQTNTQYNTAGGFHSFEVGGSEKLRISSEGNVTMGQVDSSSSSALHIRSDTSTETTLELSTKGAYNGSLPSAKISFTQQNGTEIARIKCDTHTGAANMADLVFWTNYGGLYERMRITRLGNIQQNLTSPSGTSPYQNTHWYDRDGGNYTLTAIDNNYLSATKTASGNNYNDVIYKRVRMSKNCDIEFELSGNSPSGIYRHVGFVINGDGTASHANWDRLVFRSRPANTASNQIRIDKGGGGYGFTVESSDIPTFFDGTERHILIQLRDRLVNVIVDGVVIISQKTNANFNRSQGWFGFGIYEGGESAQVYIRNLTIKNKFQRPHWLVRASGTNVSVGNQNPFPYNQIILASSDMNNSSHYNTSTYRYNVPVSGLYYCFLRVYRNGGSGSEVAFYVNGSVRNRFRPQPSGGDYVFAGSCLIQLFKGEYIDVRAFNGAFDYFYGAGNQQYSTWGGHLLD